MDEYQDTWVHRLPKTVAVDRIDFLEEIARGKHVIHIGFWGTRGSRESDMAQGTWLHSILGNAARTITGIDHNPEGVSEARNFGFDAHVADVRDVSVVRELPVTRADLVIAAEIIEHLERPGDFLDAMHSLVSPDGELVLTTPNAYRLSNVIVAITGRENVNPDHIAIYSWFTLVNLVHRHDWEVVWCKTYNGRKRNRMLMRGIDSAQKLLARRFPFVASGLILGCRPRVPV